MSEQGNRTRISIREVTPGDDPDRFLEALRAGRSGEYLIHGPLGRAPNERHVFLARDLKRNVLVALRVTPVPRQPGEYELDVPREWKDHAPACGNCGAPIRWNGKFCTQCGADVPASSDAWPAAELRAAVQERANERELEILDEVRLPDGRLYVARHRRTRALQSLRLDQTDGGDYALAATALLDDLLDDAPARRNV